MRRREIRWPEMAMPPRCGEVLETATCWPPHYMPELISRSASCSACLVSSRDFIHAFPSRVGVCLTVCRYLLLPVYALFMWWSESGLRTAKYPNINIIDGGGTERLKHFLQDFALGWYDRFRGPKVCIELVYSNVFVCPPPPPISPRVSPPPLLLARGPRTEDGAAE